MTKKSKRMIASAGCLLILLVAAEIINLSLLNEEWLKGRLQVLARTKLEGELTIGKLEFSPWSGKVSASDIHFTRNSPDSDTKLTTDSLEMQVRFLPLLARSVQIQNLELAKPHVSVVVRRAGDTGGGTTDKIKRFLKGQQDKKPKPRAIKELVVSRFVITDGALDYVATKPSGENFVAAISDLNYSATNVSLSAFHRLVFGADIDCRIRMGREAHLRKRTGDTSTLSLEGIDLNYCDRYFDQADALVVSGGTLDLACSGRLGNKSHVNVDIDISGLKLAGNPQAGQQEFMFIPVDRLIRYADSRQGKLSLTVSLDQHQLQASPDMEYLAHEFWRGMWIAIVKEVSPASIKDIVQQEKDAERRAQSRPLPLQE